MSERATVIEPSSALVLTTLRTRWAPGGPTGITMMPPTLSCCSNGGGTWSMPQVTMILSNIIGPASAGVACAAGVATGAGVALAAGVAAAAGADGASTQ